MTKLLLVFIISITFGITYAGSNHEGTVLKHQEWVTGDHTLHYKLSTSKHPVADKMNNSSQSEREHILLWPSVEHAETNYDNPKLIHTKITSTFHMQVMGFYEESEPQIFEIVRRICVIPSFDTPDDQVNCFNSKELISVTGDINNSVDVDIDIYNLTPGKYTTNVQMFVEQIVPSSHMPISYSTIGNNLQFIINANS